MEAATKQQLNSSKFITVFVPAWMITPVYHSLRRESIKNASSASPIGVQSVCLTVPSSVLIAIVLDVPLAEAKTAILSAILSQKTLILARAEKCIGLTPREACRILNGTDYTPICSLLALECNCRCKTALVINSPLPSWVLRQLDQSGFGAHCIQGVATSLGLLLLGRAQLSDRNLWTATTHPTTLKQINPKAAEKFIHRLRLFRQPILSVVSKSIAFNTFAQSVVLILHPTLGLPQKIFKCCGRQQLNSY